MEKEIIQYIYELLEYSNPPDINIYLPLFKQNIQTLITEKNSTKLSNNNYNLGNFFIGKEKEAEVSFVTWPDYFQTIFNEKEKKLLHYLKKKNLSFEKIAKIFNIYTNIVADKQNRINQKSLKNINDYIFD